MINELTQLTERIYVFDLGATLIGVLKGDNAATLIDSGMSKNHAKRLEKAAGMPVASILHTHFHADHIGGTAYFAEKYNARFFVPQAEISFAANPEINPALMYGGRVPLIYRQPFLLADTFTVCPLPGGDFTENTFTVTPIDTGGHSIAHTAFLVDGVLFLGDSVTSPEVIEKHGIIYLYNPLRAYQSLNALLGVDFDRAVLCHKDIVDKSGLSECIEAQKAHIKAVEARVLSLMDGKTAEGITMALMSECELTVTPISWLLTLSTIKGYISNIEAAELAECTFEENPAGFTMRWHKIKDGSNFA